MHIRRRSEQGISPSSPRNGLPFSSQRGRYGVRLLLHALARSVVVVKLGPLASSSATPWRWCTRGLARSTLARLLARSMVYLIEILHPLVLRRLDGASGGWSATLAGLLLPLVAAPPRLAAPPLGAGRQACCSLRLTARSVLAADDKQVGRLQCEWRRWEKLDVVTLTPVY